MKTAWLDGTTGEEREKLKEYIAGNKKVLDILVKMLYNRRTEAEKVSISDYDCPSWVAKQAHLNGRKEAFDEIIKLCTL